MATTNTEGDIYELKNAVSKLVQKKEREKNNSILIFEIGVINDGVGIYRELTFRELLSEILSEVDSTKLL